MCRVYYIYVSILHTFFIIFKNFLLTIGTLVDATTGCGAGAEIVEKATWGDGGFMPSITSSLMTKDCLSSGKLFCGKNKLLH